MLTKKKFSRNSVNFSQNTIKSTRTAAGTFVTLIKQYKWQHN